MRNQDHNQASRNTDQLQERTQRDQAERSEQALSNQGSQDRKRSQANPGRDTLRERGDREQ